MKWSVYYQTAEFLEYSRMFMILPEYEPLVRQWCGVRDAFMKLPEMQASFSQDDAAQLRMLLEEKCSWLRAHPEENTVWDWYGGANLLLTGVRP